MFWWYIFMFEMEIWYTFMANTFKSDIEISIVIIQKFQSFINFSPVGSDLKVFSIDIYQNFGFFEEIFFCSHNLHEMLVDQSSS